MIYDKLVNIDVYKSKHSYLQKAFKSIANKEYLNFKTGKNDIYGEQLFAMKVNLTLKSVDEGLFEAHKKYIDIHLPLKNSEDISVSFIEDIIITSKYDADSDCLLATANKFVDINLKYDEFLVVFPQDAHKVGVSKLNYGKEYEKIIYKIML